MDDMVYRQAAIDVLRTCYDTETVTYTNGNEYIDYDQALDLLNSLPSAQPETHEERTETHARDLISRQWLMECVNEGWIKFDTDKDENRFIHLVRDIAPSAQPEPQWIPCSERLPDKSGTYICNCVESDINHVTFIKWQSRYKRWDLNGRRTFWRVTAWKPIPEPYERRQDEQTD